MLGVVAVAILAVAAGACARPAQSAAPAAAPVVRAAPSIVGQINAYRGGGKLAVNDALTNLAAEWAMHLASTGLLQHRNLSAVGGWTNLGETIAQGPCGASDAAIVNQWLGSPPHAQVMLNPVYTSAGVARACAADGREWTVANYGS